MPRCEACQKDFNDQTGLDQHMHDKHGAEMKKAEKPADEVKKKKGFGMKGIAAVIVLIIVVAAAALVLVKPGYAVQTPDADHVTGTGTAEIIEFSDFQCPACGAAFPVVHSFLESNSDKVKFTYKHYPLTQIHPYAFKAAEASECAADQGKFWEYHDKLFQNQQALLKINLVSFAEQVGLDMEKFNACLDSGVMAERVSRDISEGSSRGIRATPTFFINGQKLEGVLTEADLERAIVA